MDVSIIRFSRNVKQAVSLFYIIPVQICFRETEQADSLFYDVYQISLFQNFLRNFASVQKFWKSSIFGLSDLSELFKTMLTTS